MVVGYIEEVGAESKLWGGSKIPLFKFNEKINNKKMLFFGRKPKKY